MNRPHTPASAGHARRSLSMSWLLILCFGSLLSVSILVVLGFAVYGATRNTVDLLRDSGFSVAVNGPPSELRHPGNANLRFGGFAAQDILGSVQPRLAASTGAACSSGTPEPSHVLRALGLGESEADSSVRFSFGRFTTDWEVRKAATLVVDVLESLVETGAALVTKSEEWV